MKKNIIFGLCIIFLSGFMLSKSVHSSAEAINDKLIRFHVVANSDSEEDQSIKLRIRDEILEKYGPILSESSSREESLQLIRDNLNEIEITADEILEEEGKDYSARAVLGESIFPIKQYGSITLPAGEYTALKVVLGEGGGKNWWCVMFPPLCFIDVTRGLTSDETNRELKRVINQEEAESITAFKQTTTKAEADSRAQESSSKVSKVGKTTKTTEKSNIIKPGVEFRFKSVELIKKTFRRLVGTF